MWATRPAGTLDCDNDEGLCRDVWLTFLWEGHAPVAKGCGAASALSIGEASMARVTKAANMSVR